MESLIRFLISVNSIYRQYLFIILYMADIVFVVVSAKAQYSKSKHRPVTEIISQTV